jgi:hypothetical protein
VINLDAGTLFDDSVLFLCQKSKEKKQIGLLRKRTLPSSCSVILERMFKEEFQGQEKVACQRLKTTLISRHPDLFELTNNPQHV